ncbi:MAG: hypothetical protein FIA89_03530 [Geobacter sp.]|nr:hypothetical protein [Geobacter sp.]
MTLFSRKQQQPNELIAEISKAGISAIDTAVPEVEPQPEQPPQPRYLHTRSGERIVYNQQLQPVILQVSSGINLQPLEVLTESNGNSYQFMYLLPVRHPECLHLLCVPV